MITVVVCAYTTKRWDLLQVAIESVECQSVPAQIVLVIDHNDELYDMCVARWPQHHVVANRFAKGLSGARNTGVTEAAGDVIAFLDDDASARDGWLESLEQAFENDPSIGGVGGRVEPAWDVPPPGWLPPEFWWVVGCSYVGLPLTACEVRNPIGANMSCQLVYRATDNSVVYSTPVTSGACSLTLTKPVKNNVVIAVICNTDYLYQGESTRTAHFDYRLVLGSGITGTANVNTQWFQ